MKRRLMSVLLALTMVLSLLPASALATEESSGAKVYWEEVDDDAITAVREDDEVSLPQTVDNTGDPNEMVRVSIVLEGRSTIESGYSTRNIANNAAAMSYRENLRREQVSVQSIIERDVLHNKPLDVVWNLTLAANIISANVRRGDIEAIKAVPGVANVEEEIQYTPQVISVGSSEAKPLMAVSGSMSGTQTAWESGYTGAGTKIAIIDTGIDDLHQSFDSTAFDYAIHKWEEENDKTVDLMDLSDVEDVFEGLNIAKQVGDSNVEKLYLNSKIPFAYNYVDKNFKADHMNDTRGEHGSHVAGISAANRFIPVKDEEGKPTGNFEEALETVKMAGNAPDAQLIVMKVFGAGGGAFESDYMAAVEDAILLGADSVNMSLGGGYAGFTTSGSYQKVLETLSKSDTVLSVAAGNTGNWAQFTTNGQLYSDGVSFCMIGNPGTFGPSLTVASVDNDGLVSNMKVGRSSITYYEGQMAEKPLFPSLDPDGKGKEFEYVLFDTLTAGKEKEAFAALKDVIKGKIVICWRGVSSFGTKANAAYQAGAAAVIIANNVPNQAFYANLGASGDEPAYSGNIPVVSITQAAGNYILNSSTPGTSNSSYRYFTGKMTVYGLPHADIYNSDYKTMSYFSSWGMPGDLSLKPEITAPGGNIWSVWGENAGGSQTFDAADHSDYEVMSGTSMAAPQIAGLAAQVQQYLRDNKLEDFEGLSSRVITQALLMSTAHPMKDSAGLYYPVFQQGAGLANVADAVSTPVFITVDTQLSPGDGKAKAELGDDPDYTGTYTIDFQLHNLSDKDASYELSLDFFTQGVETKKDGFKYLQTATRLMGTTVSFMIDGDSEDPESVEKYDFNGDGIFNTKDAQLLLDHVIKGTEISGFEEEALDLDNDGDVDTYDVHFLLNQRMSSAYVPAGKTIKVKAVVTLTEEETKKLAEENPAGAYLEGYFSATSLSNEEGAMDPTIGFPILGYYGSWTDTSMFEWGSYTELYQAYASQTKVRDPYTWGKFSSNGWASAPYNVLYVNLDKKVTIEKQSSFMTGGTLSNPDNAFSSANGLMTFANYYYSLIRGSGSTVVQVSNHETGEVYYRTDEDLRNPGAYYTDNGWANTYNYIPLSKWNGKTLADKEIPDGVTIDISVIAAPEMYADSNGRYNWQTLTDHDKTNGELGKGAYLTTSFLVDNTAPKFEGELEDAISGDEGSRTLKVSVNDNNFIYHIELYSQDGEHRVQDLPVNKSTKEGPIEVTFNNLDKDIYLVRVWDKAYNSKTYRLFLDVEPTTVVESVGILDADTMERLPQPLQMVTGESRQLYGAAYPVTLKERTVTWKTSDDTILTVDDNGLITALRSGTATITATSTWDETKSTSIKVTIRGFTMEVNAIIQDEKGDRYWSSFNTDGLPGYKQLHKIENDVKLQTAAYNGKNKTLYSTTFSSMSEGTDIYEVNPETYEIKKVAHSATAPVDTANSYTLGNLIVGVRGTDIVFYDPTVGADEDALVIAKNYSNDDLVSIVYEATVYGTKIFGDPKDVDIFYVITQKGEVYEDFMYIHDGEPYFMFGAKGVVAANRVIGYSSDVNYGSSAYFAGDGKNGKMVWACYSQARDVVDVVYWDRGDSYETGNFYRVGNLGKGVHPVGGLIDLKKLGPNGLNSPTGESSLADFLLTAEPGIATPAVGLNSIDTGEKFPEVQKSDITVDTTDHTVTVPVYAAANTNGEFTLSYDTELLTLEDVICAAGMLTSYDDETTAGEIHAGYAAKDTVNGAVFTLVFSYDTDGTANLKLKLAQEDNNKKTDETSYTVKLSLSSDPGPVDPGPVDPGPVNPGPVNPGPVNPNPGNTGTTPQNPDDQKPSGPSAKDFTDLDPDAWYYDDVNTIIEAGLMNGMGDGLFAPQSELHRGMIATILYRMSDRPPVDGENKFEDVDSDAYYANAVTWGSANGLIKGRSSKMFAPEANITRQELAVLLWRYAKFLGYDVTTDGTTIPNFTDRDQIDDWAGEAVSWAYRNGILRGRGSNVLDPNATATRAEVCTMLVRFMKLTEDDRVIPQ